MEEREKLEKHLNRLRVEVFSLMIAFTQPCSGYKLLKEYEDNFDSDIPFRKFGYPDVESLLSDHPKIDTVMFEGKRCFKAQVSEATADLQQMVSKQKKKKKNKKGGRGGFQRSNAQSRTFSSRPGMRYPGAFNDRSSLRGRGSAPGSWHRGGSVNSRPVSAMGFGQSRPNTSYNSSGFGSSSQSIRDPSGFDRSEEPAGPVVGVNRLLRALDKCNGRATLMKLNYAYLTLYNTAFDKTELDRHFGTSNMRSIAAEYLTGKVHMNVIPGGQWMFVSEEIVRKQKKWEEDNKNVVVIPKTLAWDKPTLNELYNNVVKMLMSMFPETIQLDQMSEVYARAHQIQIDPDALYRKTWEELVTKLFKDKVTLSADKRVGLNQKFITLMGLRPPSNESTSPHRAQMSRVTADDLGLQYFSEDDEESDDDSCNMSITSGYVDDSDMPTVISAMNSSSSSGRSTPSQCGNFRPASALFHSPDLLPISETKEATAAPKTTSGAFPTSFKPVSSFAICRDINSLGRETRLLETTIATVEPLVPRKKPVARFGVDPAAARGCFKDFSTKRPTSTSPQSTFVSPFVRSIPTRRSEIVSSGAPRESVFSRLSYREPVRERELTESDSTSVSADSTRTCIESAPISSTTTREHKADQPNNGQNAVMQLSGQLNKMNLSVSSSSSVNEPVSIVPCESSATVEKKRGFGFRSVKKVFSSLSTKLSGSSTSLSKNSVVDSTHDAVPVNLNTTGSVFETKFAGSAPLHVKFPNSFIKARLQSGPHGQFRDLNSSSSDA